ncbi:hypothetical protein V3F56_03605 [Moorellaceae bacterium AZ2]
MGKGTRRPVRAWQAGETLVLACPSFSSEGYYLVAAKRLGDVLKVAHSCPAASMGRRCWHVDAAVEAYREWRWWEEPPSEVERLVRPVAWSSAWEEIPVPGYEFEEQEGGAVYGGWKHTA